MASSAFKICPTCQKLWAATFKFCPEHGSQLVEQAPPEPTPAKAKAPSRRSSRILDLPPVTASPTSPSTPSAASLATPAPAASEAPGPQRGGLVRGGAATKLARPETTAAETPKAKAPAARSQEGQRSTPSRTAPTLLLTPAISEEVVEKALSRARQAPTQPELVPVEAERAPSQADTKKKRAGFSETEWFLAPIKPDEVDAKTGKVKVDPSKYERNPATPEEKRRRFSLKRDDEE